MRLLGRVLLGAASLLIAAGCGGDTKKNADDGDADAGTDGGSKAFVSPWPEPEACDVVVSDADCDKSLRPIVFVHGTFGSGDQFAHQAMLFGSNGYCQDRIVALEYNSVTLNNDITDELDALIDDILAKTGAEQVELLGHSQGTSHCVAYLGDPARAAKVAHYINLSGTTEIPEGVHAFSITSENDIGGARQAPGAEEEFTFVEEDHIDLASSPQSFAKIYNYLFGKAPQYTDVKCGDEEITLDGIAETFGDNVPVTDGRLEVYELGADPRQRGEPVMVITAGKNGHTEPFKLKRLTPYEFKAIGADGKLVGHAYFAPFKRSNYLARFLGPSENPLVSTLSTDQVVVGPHHAALVFRNAEGSFRHDQGQSLKIDGDEVLTDDTAGKSTMTVGLFMSDQNENEKTDLGVAFSAPFVMGTDVFMNADEPAWIEIDWNGKKQYVPNWPSSEGMMSIMLP